MLVQRVLMPGSGRESWTLPGGDGAVAGPAERYLAYLAAIERSPNTVRAYAVSLKLWFEFLQLTATRWDQACAWVLSILLQENLGPQDPLAGEIAAV